MNVGIVGGGPAGLFFAYLMKRQDATHRIRVVERDPADATYGWGVVFTDIALAFVRDVAPELYAAMTRHQEVHDAMRIVHRGQAVALANNTFHRMARIDLLRTLRQHCADLGVAIEFGRKVDGVDEFADCDLIVAADGAASTIRTRYREHFEPTIDLRPNFLAWYGTTCLFEPLSLIFRENGDGLLIAHTYRYSRTHSTFLVECDPQTWRHAGLDRMTEPESLAYCEQVFRDDLDGHPLLSNKSDWFRYPCAPAAGPGATACCWATRCARATRRWDRGRAWRCRTPSRCSTPGGPAATTLRRSSPSSNAAGGPDPMPYRRRR